MTSSTYLSLSGAAARSGLSIQTLRRLLGSGELTAYNLGPRIIRVNISDLDQLKLTGRTA